MKKKEAKEKLLDQYILQGWGVGKNTPHFRDDVTGGSNFYLCLFFNTE